MCFPKEEFKQMGLEIFPLYVFPCRSFMSATLQCPCASVGKCPPGFERHSFGDKELLNQY